MRCRQMCRVSSEWFVQPLAGNQWLLSKPLSGSELEVAIEHRSLMESATMCVTTAKDMTKADQDQAEKVTMEDQVRRLDARHREQAERLQMLQQMEKQKMVELCQQAAETQCEIWEGEITDDEDCIGQYRTPSSPTSPQASHLRDSIDDAARGMMMRTSSTLVSPSCVSTRPPQTVVLLPALIHGSEHSYSQLNQDFIRGKMFHATYSTSGGSTLEWNMQFENTKIGETQQDCRLGAGAAQQVRRHSCGNLRKTSTRATHSDQWQDDTVTVMMRNIPPHHTQQKLVEELHRRGFEGCFDFLYLPHNFKLNINVGYAFINFIEPKYALKFYRDLDGQCLTKYMRQKGKFIRVHPAQLQGYEATYDHFMRTKIAQKQDPAFSPLFR